MSIVGGFALLWAYKSQTTHGLRSKRWRVSLSVFEALLEESGRYVATCSKHEPSSLKVDEQVYVVLDGSLPEGHAVPMRDDE